MRPESNLEIIIFGFSIKLYGKIFNSLKIDFKYLEEIEDTWVEEVQYHGGFTSYFAKMKVRGVLFRYITIRYIVKLGTIWPIRKSQEAYELIYQKVKQFENYKKHENNGRIKSIRRIDNEL